MISKLKQVFGNTIKLRRAIKFVWESAPGWTVANLLTLIIEGLLPVAQLYLLKILLDEVSAALLSSNPYAFLSRVVFLVAVTGGITLLTNLTYSFGKVVSRMQSRAVADHMYDVLHAKSIEVDLEYYENAEYFDRLHRAQEDASDRPLMIIDALAKILRSAISLTGVLVLLIAFHWVIAVVLVVAVLPNIIVRLHFSNLSFQLYRQYTGADREAWYYHLLMTSIDFAKEIRVFGAGPYFIRKYNQLRDTLRQVSLRLDLRRAWFELAAGALATTTVYASYAFIASRVIAGLATLGDLAMYYQAFQRGLGFLQEFLTGFTDLYESNLFLTNLYEFLDLKSKITAPSSPRAFPKPMRSGIVFDHVSFQYPTSQREALRDIQLEIHPGEVIALVGENGSGKTTLVKLLCRLYDPNQGQITIDGIGLSEFHPGDLRQEIGVIFQDYAHYNLSARLNIEIGDINNPADDQRVQAAATRADIHRTIQSLPHGYETVLGKLFEDGEELSIGQWQKIALARAFLRRSQVIILDEPTSALDPRAEYEVFLKFRELLENRTAILISHRLSTVRMADRIYVMQDGRIVERGTHDQLIAQGGHYAQLYEIQARQYQLSGNQHQPIPNQPI